jgi:hypothetical protein
VRFAGDRVGQLSVTFGVKILGDSHLRDARPERPVEQKATAKADAKCHLSRAIFYIFYARESKTRAKSLNFGVADGIRTHDNRNHNPGLYQLSYSHH